MELLPAIRKSIITFALLPALLYAGIPPTLQSDASQRMTKDIMDRVYITPKRIVTKYAGCKNNLIKDEHYLLERGNGQSEMNRKKCLQKVYIFMKLDIKWHFRSPSHWISAVNCMED